MSFPDTRHTLIQRIAAGGSDQDWRQLLADYWGPICRFAAYRAHLSPADAEEIASKTFEAMLKGQLLSRWSANPTAKLRTLLCTVVRNTLSNQARVQQGRQRLMKEHAESAPSDDPLAAGLAGELTVEDADAFYVAWADDVVQKSIESVRDELHRTGKGDYFRTLYGRVCEEMTTREVAEALGIKATDAENYFKAAKKQLAKELEAQVRRHVERYGDQQEARADFEAEWQRLGEHLQNHGGMERVVRRCYEQDSEGRRFDRRADSFIRTAALFGRD